MLFNSHVFLFAFLPVTLLVFFALGGTNRRRAALAWLTAASLFFYGWWQPSNLLVIGGSMAWNFCLGRMLCGRSRPHARQILLVAGIAGNLVLLGYYKYAIFLIENVNAWLGSTHDLAPIVLPLGISFFTFQQISYIVDAYRGKSREHNFVHYCLFVTFFPHLIAGPLVHHGDMLPQFTRPSAFRPARRNLEVGLTIFFIGLFKKVVIADGVAGYAAPVFAAAEHGANLACLEAWCGAVAYALQLYFDFSAYSDMAIGLARLFGIRLPLNFHSPYKATSIIDFWRRWHMSLSRFLREYLYIPLGGNNKGPARRYVNLMVTMLLGGLWHGAGWTFVVWGGLHGVFLIINHAWRAASVRVRPAGIPASRASHVFAGCLTFASVLVGWVIFRASNLSTAGSILNAMAGRNGFALPEQYLPVVARVPGLAELLSTCGVSFAKLEYFSGAGELVALAALLSIVWFAPNTQQIMQRFRPVYETLSGEDRAGCPSWLQWRRNGRWALAMSAVTVVAVLHLSRISEFLYFQF